MNNKTIKIKKKKKARISHRDSLSVRAGTGSLQGNLSNKTKTQA
jgi:hypothetical protein